MSPELYLLAYMLGMLTGLALAVACEWLVATVRHWWADRLLRKGFKAARRMGYLPTDSRTRQ